MKALFKRILLSMIAVALVFSAAGCGKGGKITLNVYNWGDYMDEGVLKVFEEKTGIHINYETYATNEDMYTKIKSGGANYDVAFPSDYMIKRMINEGLLNKIDLNHVPNFKSIDPQFKNLAFDPKNEYSVPYMWGTVGIIYNKKMIKEPVDSWKILWDKKYSKQILMMDSQRDSIGITLKMLGYSLNTKKADELEAAKKKLIEQKPLVLAYVVDEVKDKMIAGEAALAVVWSGDAITMKRQNPDLEYVIPKEGSNLWFDGIVIPKTSKHPKEAEAFLNFMCETDTALKNANFIGYSTPHTEAKFKLDKDVVEDKTAYPDQQMLKGCEIFEDLSDSLKEYDRIWTEIKAE